MPTALVQKRPDRLAGPTFAAADGFKQLGYEIEYFDTEALLAGRLELSPDKVVVAGVGAFFAALRQLGIPRPGFHSMPPELLPFAGRRVLETTLVEARRLPPPLFVKPKEDTKSFTGFVVGHDGNWSRTAAQPNNLLVVVSDPVRFVAEFRCFVLKSAVVDIRRYAIDADPLIFPDPAVIRKAVAALAPIAPSAYALDVGVLDDGRTVAVEANDGHSLGDYGMFPLMYARFLETRWCELSGALPIP